jgi:hypothetical protein
MTESGRKGQVAGLLAVRGAEVGQPRRRQVGGVSGFWRQ